MEFIDLDRKPPEDPIYVIKYEGSTPEYSGCEFYLVPFGELEKRVFVVIRDPRIRTNGTTPDEVKIKADGTMPDEVKLEIKRSAEKLGIGHLELMFPAQGDTFLEN